MNFKATGTSFAGFINWAAALAVHEYMSGVFSYNPYTDTSEVAKLYNLCFLNCVICILGSLHTKFIMIETKGKTFIEIHKELGFS